MKNIIHQKAEDRLAENSSATVSAIKENSQKVEEVTRAVKDLHTSSKDKSLEAEGFKAVVQSVKDSPEKVVRKLEEVKSAALISNKHLKEIANKKDKEVQKVEVINEKPEKEVQKIEFVNKDADLAAAFFSLLKGPKGEPGRNPLTVSDKEPANPQIGDIWYQP